MMGEEATRDTKRGSAVWRERVGLAVRHAREARGVTQTELADAVDVDIATIGKTERGETVPDYATVEAVADYLGVPIDTLMGRRPEKRAGLESLAAGDFPQSSEGHHQAISALADEVVRNRNAIRRLTKPLGRISRDLDQE